MSKLSDWVVNLFGCLMICIAVIAEFVFPIALVVALVFGIIKWCGKSESDKEIKIQQQKIEKQNEEALEEMKKMNKWLEKNAEIQRNRNRPLRNY